MPIINVTTWPTSDEKKRQMILEITRVVHETTGAPLNKITVYVQEIKKSSWAEAGIFGDDPEFSVKSKRSIYEMKGK
jgi:4-oxalocrotonate tautomerase